MSEGEKSLNQVDELFLGCLGAIMGLVGTFVIPTLAWAYVVQSYADWFWVSGLFPELPEGSIGFTSAIYIVLIIRLIGMIGLGTLIKQSVKEQREEAANDPQSLTLQIVRPIIEGVGYAALFWTFGWIWQFFV